MTLESETERVASLRRNVIANYVGRAYSMGANYLFIPFYVRILGVEAYGVIAFYALLLTITSLADIGLSATFSREAARQRNPGELVRLLATAERILLLAVSGCALLIFFSAGWIAEHWLNSGGALGADAIIWPLRLMALMLAPQLMIILYTAGLLGLQRQFEANLIQSLFITVRSGLVILPMLWWANLTLFFAWQLAATLIFAAVARMALVRSMGLGLFAGAPFDWPALRPHLRYAGGMLAITLISSINTQLDKALISRLFTLAEFGYYNIASTLAQLPVAGVTPIVVAFFPRLVACVADRDVAERRRIYDEFARLIAFVAALGAFGLALFAPDLLTLWLHDPHLPAVMAQVTATLAIGSLVMCLNMAPYYLCLAQGQSWRIVIVATAALLVSVPATVLAIFAFGLLGGAMSWLLLNLMNLLMLTVAAARLQTGISLASHLRSAPIPMLVALVPLIIARLLTHALQASPLVGCALAAAGAAIAVLAFATISPARVLARMKI